MRDRMSVMRLFDENGRRLYLTADERQRFLQASELETPMRRLFCEVLHYSGCRPTEALELTPARIQQEDKTLVFRSLKKRKLTRKGEVKAPMYRVVPVPDAVITHLNLVFNLVTLQASQACLDVPVFTMSRPTAWRLVKQVMQRAGVFGVQATAKGLRHSFGVHMMSHGVPLTVLRDLLGHTDTKTTEIYLQAVGKEKRDMVINAWE